MESLLNILHYIVYNNVKLTFHKELQNEKQTRRNTEETWY